MNKQPVNGGKGINEKNTVREAGGCFKRTRADVAVIGGGPAGLAAAIGAADEGAKVVLIERESRLGGILKQCIHDGFGLIRFGEKLSGPEYAYRYEKEFKERNIQCRLLSYASKIEKKDGVFHLSLISADGIEKLEVKSIVLATGCRERTARQIGIHGEKPSGVLTAGSAQYYTNILGQRPGKRCVILGSGDIGLIMARRLTLEGSHVVGVFEAKSSPSGLSRNIQQCLNDFDIPLYTKKTVSRVFGPSRLEGVEISSVDENMKPLPGSEEIILCDALILSVGLIPENELAESLGVGLDKKTGGPYCDQNHMTDKEGVFSCGNALHVSDLADYVSESGDAAGRGAAAYAQGQKRGWADVEVNEGLHYVVPSKIDVENIRGSVVFYFRSARETGKSILRVKQGGKLIFSKKYNMLPPPEMERIEVKENENFRFSSKGLSFELEEIKGGDTP